MKILNFFKKDSIIEPPYEYNFLYNLKESEYPKYLKKIYKYKTGENLNLKHPKTLNEKIQWIKLYGVTQLMRDCTDKVKVRDFVKEKIGEEYLKPVLQIIPNESQETVSCHCEQTNNHLMSARQSTARSSDTLDCRGTQNVVVPRNDGESGDVSAYFDEIDFCKLPNAFVLKCNHGCKWQYIIKNKKEFLKNKRLFELVKRNMTGWLEQDYSFWGGFEMNYHGIEPKILIEPLLRDEINTPCEEIMVYFFKGIPKFTIKIHNNRTITVYDENLEITNAPFDFEEEKVNIKADNIINQTFVLSKQLLKDMNVELVRIDWLISQNKPYFEEFTFTPYSGYSKSLERLQA